LAPDEAAPDFGFHNQPNSDSEPVWTYRGYRLKSTEFTTAMVHFHRAEVARANVWRQRLDATTNWAVVSTGAALTVSFSQQAGHHGIILLTSLLITLFLYIEARRYRYYELWSKRVRLMETDFFAAMLVPPFKPDPDWAEGLAESLLHPEFPITMWEAVGRRLRRNYFWIYVILGIAWIAKNALFPAPVTSLSQFIARMEIGPISGSIVMLVVVSFGVLIVLFSLLTVGMHAASGEVLPRYLVEFPGFGTGQQKSIRKWFRTIQKRKQLLALIITDFPEEVSAVLLREMSRGVTSIPGRGMYTGKDHGVLLCALTVTEVSHLKALVAESDPKAFVIVAPAEEILGAGFEPLKI
jgi:uncharacterized membrane protein